MKSGMSFIKLPMALIFLLSLAVSAQANPILQGFSSDGSTFTMTHTDADDISRSAEAVFSIEGDYLKIVIANTQPDSETPNQLLAGIFFDYSVDLGLPVGVELSEGS